MPTPLPPTYPSLPAARPPTQAAGTARLTPDGREGWKGSDILSRCAVSPRLANAIIGGPGATDQYVLGLVRANEGRADVRAELADIYLRLGCGSATYGDLQRLERIAQRG